MSMISGGAHLVGDAAGGTGAFTQRAPVPLFLLSPRLAMVRTLYALAVFLATVPLASAQPPDLPLGLGIATPVELGAASPLYFYGSPDGHPHTASPLDSLTIREGAHHYEIDRAPPWLDPEVARMDGDLLSLRVVSLRRHWAEVVVHNRDVRWPPRTMWVDRDRIAFRPWAAYWLEIHSVETQHAAPIHAGPGSDMPAVGRTEAGRPLQVLQTHHGWARVGLAEAREAESGLLGWIRWHDGERLLVRYSVLN